MVKTDGVWTGSVWQPSIAGADQTWGCLAAERGNLTIGGRRAQSPLQPQALVR